MDRTDIESNKEGYVTVGCDCGMTELKFTRSDRHLSEMGDDRAIADDGVPCTQSYVVYLLNAYEELVNELKERNKRQCERLKEITDLMMERDWKSLEEIVEDWEESDRLLQAEWGTYGE